MTFNAAYRRELIAMDTETLNAEVRAASNRLTATKRAYRNGAAAWMDVERARADFYLARGIKTQLDKFGAV